jgi:hypothetical protein
MTDLWVSSTLPVGVGKKGAALIKLKPATPKL